MVLDRYVMHDDIETHLKISKICMHAILHGHLKMKKKRSRWITHNLFQTEKDTRGIWCQKNLYKFNSHFSKQYKIS